jgi:hypothetical protein
MARSVAKISKNQIGMRQHDYIQIDPIAAARLKLHGRIVI